MIHIRKAADRGHFNHGWLDTYHTFSFAGYQDPGHMGFRALRVINEDRVKPAQGFGTHGHRDMEILTYVLDGALDHKDSLGNGGKLRPGDVQRMSAGRGMQHSEFNGSDQETAHFLQIWLLPDRNGVAPRYDDRDFPLEERRNRLCLIASPDAADRSLSLYQDARVYAAVLDAGREVTLELPKGRHAWVQIARGEPALGYGFGPAQGGLDCAGEWTTLQAGDGVAASEEARLTVRAEKPCELLMFDLA